MIDEEHDRRITSFTNSKKKKKSDDYWLGEIYVDVGVVSLDKFVKIGTQASVQYTGTITEQVG